MTALANRAYVATGTTYANMDIGLLAMYDALSEATEKAELDIISASTCDIGSMASTKLRITGTATITSFGTVYRGPILMRMAAALTITYNATTLLCPGNVSMVTAAGDVLMAWPKATTSGAADGWQVVRLARGTNTLPIAEGGTGKITASEAFDAIKQQGSSSETGVWESATDSEAQAGTDATRCVTPDNLGAVVFGLGQAYVDMRASRAVSTTYTNSTGRTILITVAGSLSASNAVLQVAINGFNIVTANGAYSAGSWACVQAVIPPGNTYAITTSAGTFTIAVWAELR